MATEVLIVETEHTTLDLLLWRRFRHEHPGLVEATADRNYGLADLGPVLPVGTRVEVEIPTPAARRAPARVVRLWD